MLATTLLLANTSYAQDLWGSVYLDKPTGTTGFASNYMSKATANKAAQAACVKNLKGKPDNCQRMTSFYNACVAVYWSPTTKIHGWGTNNLSLKTAKAAAARSCRSKGAEDCKLVKSFCTDLYY